MKISGRSSGAKNKFKFCCYKQIAPLELKTNQIISSEGTAYL